MSENIDGAGRRSPGPRLLVRPLLLFASVALVIGFVAVRTDVEPYKTPFFRLFFSNTLHICRQNISDIRFDILRECLAHLV